ncbi:nudix hydrolase 4-like [Corylus avellana]|uniref:nudix hydrolase 4-like n=1 Tax=Corylus avellana TaxID=13451 RepID=UPI001E210EA1|nr:nudix hydrolase 4-like [Corylus avellana]
MGLLLSKNPANLLMFFEFVSKRIRFDWVEKEKNMVSLVSRTGRCLQRYDMKGYRQVVGCIPYRYRETNQSSSIKELEVLLISSQKGQAMMFPKGGWEKDESMEDAAKRETLEEAGVTGKVEKKLGVWPYKSKRQEIMHEGYMFPLHVSQQFDRWPEEKLRLRKWMTVAEAREVCQCGWMKEALDELVNRQLKPQEANETICT